MDERREEAGRGRIRWGEMGLVWAALTALSLVGGLVVIPHLMPRAASHTMHLNILTMVVFSVAAAPVGSLVYAVAIYALRHWRVDSGDVPPADGPPLRQNTGLSVVWISTAGLLCVFLLIWGLAAMASDSAAAQRPALTVDVTGQQWLWTYHYAGTTVTTAQPELPDNESVQFRVTSLDVVHGFWIVQMGIKVDANPGEVTTASVTPDQLGTFDVRCSELCGLYHAFMTSQIKVVTPAQFRVWLSAQGS